MPLFEYKCAKCGAGFEVLVRSEKDTPKSCPKCGARKVEKQLSSFSASVSDGGVNLPSCATSGACGTGACPTGSCPFGGN